MLDHAPRPLLVKVPHERKHGLKIGVVLRDDQFVGIRVGHDLPHSRFEILQKGQ